MFCFLLSDGSWDGYQGRRHLLFIRDGEDQTLLLNKTSHQPHLLEWIDSRPGDPLCQIFLRGVEGHKYPMWSIEFVKCTGRSKNSEKFRALWPAENWHFYWPIRPFYIHKPGLSADCERKDTTKYHSASRIFLVNVLRSAVGGWGPGDGWWTRTNSVQCPTVLPPWSSNDRLIASSPAPVLATCYYYSTSHHPNASSTLCTCSPRKMVSREKIKNIESC